MCGAIAGAAQFSVHAGNAHAHQPTHHRHVHAPHTVHLEPPYFLAGVTTSDEIVKGAMAGDVFEHLEIATDTARLGAAKTVGDVETRRVCEQILPQEQAMADQLLAHLRELTEGFLARDASPGVTAKK